MADAQPLSFELTLPDAASPGRCRFLGMRGTEALGRLFEFHIRFSSDKPAIDPLKMLGDMVALAMETADGTRHFHAYITAFEFRGPIELPLTVNAEAVPQFEYAIVARPWLWFLTRSADCRVFQTLKVPEIIDKIFEKYPGLVKKQLDGEYLPWEYCVQYRETDFNFVSRLMEQEGVFYYFEHDENEHHLVLVDLHGPTTETKHRIAYVPGARAGRMEKECVYEWCVAHEVQPGAYAIKDFDFKKPSSPRLSVVKRPFKHEQGNLEVFDYPGEFDSSGEGDTYVRVRLDELRAQFETVRARCNLRTLAAGDVFELSNPEQAGAAGKTKFLVTEAAFDLSSGLESEAHGPSYRCDFTCIRAAEQFRPRRLTPKPIVQGPQTATVVGPSGEEIYTEEHGRIKVRFHWDRHSKDETESSCWIRVSQPWAGKGWGGVSIPRIDQEVIVEFLEGDPDRPIVTGRVYNGEQTPPFPLPAGAVISGLKSNTHKGRGYNELSMDDTAGKEKVTIHGQYDMATTVEHDQTTTVHNNRTDAIDVDDSETVGSNQTLDVGSNQTISIGANRSESVGGTETITITGHRTETVNGGETVTVTGGRSHTVNGVQTTTISLAEVHSVGAGRMHNVGAAEAVTVGGAQMVNVGGAQMVSVGGVQRVNVGSLQSVGVSGPHKLSAAVIQQTSKGVFKIKAGGTTMIEAPTIILKAGGSKIIMNSSGVTIKGAKIVAKASGNVTINGGSGIKLKGPNIGEN